MNPVADGPGSWSARARRNRGRPIHWILSGVGLELALAAPSYADRPEIRPSVKDATPGRPAAEDVSRFRDLVAAGRQSSVCRTTSRKTFGLTRSRHGGGLPWWWRTGTGTPRSRRGRGARASASPPTMAAPGLGGDLAVAHANGWESYDHYVGMASMSSPSMSTPRPTPCSGCRKRRPSPAHRGGGQARARSVFDWKTVIGHTRAVVRTRAVRQGGGDQADPAR